MKILVPIRKVPDTTAKITFKDDNTKFNEQNVQFVMNPTDEWYALVRAVELKEKNGGTVTVINVGPAANDQIIRKALAIGADNAVRVDAEETVDGFFNAKEIANYAKEQGFDMVITGKETIDNNAFDLAPMIAEFLDLPCVALATSLEVEGGKATAKREIEGGEEEVEVALPCVISAQKGMAEQRIPNMRGIMMARSKPLTVVPASGSEAKTAVKAFVLPPAKGDVKLVDADNVAELVNLLHTEAKAI